MAERSPSGTRPSWVLADLEPAALFDLLLSLEPGELPVTLATTAEISIPPSAFGVSADLHVPVSPEYEPLLRRFLETAERSAEQAPVAEGALPVVAGLCHLLFAAAPERQAASTLPDTYLLIAEGRDAAGAAEIFDELRRHATALRVATAESAAGPIWFFQIQDDPRRKSTFQSVLAGGDLDDCRLLLGIAEGERRLYVPLERAALDASLFLRFQALMLRHPSLFGLAPDAVESQALAAIEVRSPDASSPEGSEETWVFWPLAQLTFHARVALEPALSGGARFEMPALRYSPERLEELQHALHRAAPQFGYRLELRPTRLREPAEIERRRLRDRLAEIEYRLAGLDSMHAAKPWLWRFRQRQLPVLARLLRDMPMDVLREGRLLYAFHADEFDPAGSHFLWIPAEDGGFDPEEAMLYGDDAPDAMCFWLDPYWARYYSEENEACWVFVPRHSALFPPMHDWHTADMAGYLRRVMSRWFADVADGDTQWPAEPIYLFDGQPGPETRLHVRVLDRSAFAPLHTRLDWLNDNLIVAREVGIEPLVRAMAEDTSRQRLVRFLAVRAKQSQRDFDRLAHTIGNRMVNRFESLFALLDEESENVLEEAYATAGELHDLKQGLSRLTKVKSDMNEMLAEAEDHLHEAEAQSVSLSRELHLLETKLKQAMRTRRRMSDEVMDEVRALRELHDDLKERFHKMLKMEKPS